MADPFVGSRAERVAHARALREQGLKIREIAQRMDCSISAAGAYLTDPDLSKQRARRERYRGRCVDCGAPTDGSGGPGHARLRCMDCIRWSDEAIVAAMRRWAEKHGRSPTVKDWLTTAGDEYPCAATVVRRFGWNVALQRAGLPMSQDKTPERQAWIEARLRQGLSIVQVASELGVTTPAIYQRLRRRGLTVEQLRTLERAA